MRVENLINFDLEMYPDVLDMLDGVSAGDIVRVSGAFQVKELTDKRFTASFDDTDSDIKISKKGGDEEPEIEDDQDEEETAVSTEEEAGG